jgi:2-keto-myo-inositol isomerase
MITFAINHIAAPRLDVAGFAALARGLGMSDIEIRNDLPGVALRDGTAADAVRAAAGDVTILGINALQRFDDWNAARAAEAEALAAYAAACGARALVLVPTNDRADARDPERRAAGLRDALTALRRILSARGLTGLVEPLGFSECALRLKATALDAIDGIDGADVFRVVHDTFHHFLSGETAIFPARTGLVHISGVEDARPPRDEIRDAHRVLVGPGDLMDNVGQIRALRAGGYVGAFSFEPFAESVQTLPDIAPALRDSMAFVQSNIDPRGT